MSNDLTVPFSGQKPAQAFATVGQIESLSEGIGSSYGVIGYRGKVWSLKYRGETHTIVRPDDKTPAGHIDVVILRQAKTKSKSYYEGGYDLTGSAGKRPTCASLDGIVPDDDVLKKQSNACAICPKNAWKVDVNGRKGRECTDYKRLAVLLMPAQSQAILGKPLMEPVFLRIPPASLNDLAIFGETMAGQGWHFTSFITRITFDADAAHPKMVFRPLQPLTDAEAPVILPLVADTLAIRIVGEDSIGSNRPALAAPAPLAQIAPPPSAPIVAQPHPTPTPAPAPQPQLLITPTPPATPITTGLATAPTASPSNMGLLGVIAATPPPAQTAPVAQTHADTGAPSESDADLDARIANLLK